jgi:hypothetical protein
MSYEIEVARLVISESDLKAERFKFVPPHPHRCRSYRSQAQRCETASRARQPCAV